jgi:N-acetylneuraminate synthase
MQKTEIIAEIGINHNGSVDLGKQLIDACKSAGADFAKFQMRNLGLLYRDRHDYMDEDLSSQYVLDILNKFNMNEDDLFSLFDYCKEVEIIPLCTPWELDSFKKLEEYGMSAYKTASADLTNHELLKAIALTSKPMFVSTGMSSEEEIKESVHLLKRLKGSFTLMHCNSTYPAPFKDINLNYLSVLQKISGRSVGYSGHERGISVPIAAVALGCSVIEKHITLSNDMEGNDHKVSLLPEEFALMVESIREVEQSMGTGNPRVCSSGELINREGLSKSIVARVDIEKNKIITRRDLDIKSPGRGLQPNRLRDVIGKVSKRDIPQGHFLYEFDIRDSISAKNYNISRRWGVPVRFHDYKFFLENSNVKFLEFHLSYNDLSFDIENLFGDILHDVDLVVHSPDVFEGDHLLDTSHDDEEYRQKSIENLRRVVSLTKKMRPFFKTKGKTTIIVSIGGATRDGWMDRHKKAEAYKRVALSLDEVDDPEVEIMLQTLPPFPWYFGGQLFLNLFVDANEIVEFCKKYNRRICLDTSHSQLACNQSNNDFLHWVNLFKPYIGHMHIADAHGVDREGVQMGYGNVDFEKIFEIISDPNINFIPEIWQGHKNFGEECWKALNYMENLFEAEGELK